MRSGRLGLGVLLICAALLALAAAHTEALLPLSIRPAPAAFSGAFGRVDLDLHVGGSIAVLALMCGAYGLVVVKAARGELSGRAVLVTVVGVQVLVALAAPLVSTDVFSYEAYARMAAVYGIDPYTHGPIAIRLDAVFALVGARWSATPSVYGPLFTAGSELLARVGTAASVAAYKAIALAASLGLVAAISRCARLRGVDPVRAVALVGLNPLLVVDGVGGAHNDLLMLLVLTLGLWALLAGHDRAGGALAGLAVGVKLTALIALPFALADPGREREPATRRRLTGMAGGLGLVVAAGVGSFGPGTLHLLSTIHATQTTSGWDSIPGAISTRLDLPGLGRVAGVALAGAFAVIVVALLVAVRHGRLDWVDATGWATLALLVAASALLPWYVTWLLPFAALAHDRRLVTGALVITVLVQVVQLLGLIPHG